MKTKSLYKNEEYDIEVTCTKDKVKFCISPQIEFYDNLVTIRLGECYKIYPLFDSPILIKQDYQLNNIPCFIFDLIFSVLTIRKG